MANVKSTSIAWEWVQDNYEILRDGLDACESEHQIRRHLLGMARMGRTLDSEHVTMSDWHWIAGTLLWMKMNGVTFSTSIK